MRRTAVVGEVRSASSAGKTPYGGASSAGKTPYGGAGRPGAGVQPGTGVLWETLRGVVSGQAAATGRASLDVVDVGGGTGGFAVPLARLGHSVTVIDPSPDSLAAAQRRAAEAGVPLRAVQGDVSDLAAASGAAGADLVLCHSVLEYVDSPAAAMAAIAAILRPDGVVSVLAASAVATVIHRVLAGRFDEARRLIEAVPLDSGEAAGVGLDRTVKTNSSPEGLPRRFTLPAVVQLIEQSGLRPGAGHGVGVFTGLVPSMLTDTDPGAVAALFALEEAAAAHPAFRGMATQFHVLGYR
jgi:S-adenosylmethionine-dependent methyltransferase